MSTDTRHPLDRITPIMPTGHVQWDIYRILREAFCPYRGLTVETDAIPQADLTKTLQFNLYIKMICRNAAGARTVIALLGRDEEETSEVIAATEKFRMFINNVKEADADIIVVSPAAPEKHVQNYIDALPFASRLHIYSYDNFKVVVPLGPYCMKHTIIAPDEAERRLTEIRTTRPDIKRINITDPQIIWLGARVGDIIWIDRVNASSGMSCDIRRVV